MTNKEVQELIIWMTDPGKDFGWDKRFVRQNGSTDFITTDDEISEKEKKMFYTPEDIVRIFKQTKK